ncbi:FAD-dependent oxidoreductase [Alkalibacillus salilacus]|uniref:NADPH-dependent 2,4-dienoyl-CoA reductase/sulfur reductase-like enzyme n=1 Tax=Alkalibacillus salilacus TaxID=284582 RepID=A0ABT9VGY3_9BACI|nr:FAD-dependent oxidoreductase [Alkalibacillus salilacus]MDQ0160080.1 NADPH-dependent 2,4-dienoyl-CoA reductase/sulfur reductase-like enzyme [Alkalibacillus salilacus]
MRYVIIGGDASGMSAAMQIKRESTQDDQIITLEKGDYYSYGQCGLPYVISGDVQSTDDVIAKPVEVFRQKHGIDARTQHEVTAVDPNKQVVSGVNLENDEPFEIEYDKLLIATGVRPVKPDWDGIDLNGIHSMKTIPDTNKIITDLQSEEPETVTIIGGGFIGLEIAENMREIGKHVRIIQASQQLMNPIDYEMAKLLHDEAEQQGVELIFNEFVQRFEGDQRVEKVVTDQGEYPTDQAIVNIGVKPNTDFLDPNVFDLNDQGAILVNEYMETNINNVHAAGDCAVDYNRVKQQNDFIPLGTTANKQGMIAGMNIVGREKSFQGIIGTSILKFFTLDVARTGLSEKEAESLGFDYRVVSIKTNAVAGYYDQQPLHLKLVYEQDSRKLLGGQAVGTTGADKRIDVLATALYHNMSTVDLLNLDLAYSPPYNGVWDPLQQAAKKTL